MLVTLQSPNLQAPNPKQYRNSNFELPKRICFGFRSFGDWRLFGIWDLEIGISALFGSGSAELGGSL
jgi:hypothetical protein